jgi:hypothetical protein
MDCYEDVFVNPSGANMAELEFTSSFKKTDEFLLQWHTRLRGLYARAFPQDDLLSWLKDHFALQIRNRNLTYQLRTSPEYRDYNYTALLQRAQDVAASFILCKEAYNAPGSANNNAITTTIASIPPLEEAAIRCHFCKEIGHRINVCKHMTNAIERVRRNPQLLNVNPNAGSNPGTC